MLKMANTVFLSRVGNEIILVDNSTGKYYGLNPVGARIVELLLDGSNDESALRNLVAEYDVSEAEVRTDIQRILNDLRSRGLIDEPP